jgi:hypothetical protein
MLGVIVECVIFEAHVGYRGDKNHSQLQKALFPSTMKKLLAVL